MSTPHPQETDAVLGDRLLSPAGSWVLGGLEGIQKRFSSAIAAQRLAALRELQHSEFDPLDLLLLALQDRSIEVQRAAYLMLQTHPAPEAQRAIENFCTYPLFEELHCLRGHTQGITAVALSANEQVLVSGSRDRCLKVWDLRALEEMFTVSVPAFIDTLTISPDDRSVVVKTKDQWAMAWSLRNAQPMPIEHLPEIWTASAIDRPTPSPTLCDWVDDDAQWQRPDWLVSKSGQSEAGQPEPSQPEPSQADRLKLRGIASVMMSDRRYLISGSQNTIRLWDLQAGREINVLRGHTSLVTAVAVGTSRSMIISGSEDKTLRVWGIPQ